MLNIRHFFNGLQIVPRADGATAPTTQGDLAVSSVNGNLYYNNGTTTESISTDSNSQIIINKTISVASNNIIGQIDGTAAQFDPSTGNLESSITTSIELGYVHGVTSPIQTQLNAITSAAIDGLIGDVTATGPGTVTASLTATTNGTITTLSALSLSGSQVTGNISGNASNVTGVVGLINGGTGIAASSANIAYNALSPMITTGDIEYEVSNGIAGRLPIGLNNQILTVNSGVPSWKTFTALTNPMTTEGDIIYSSDNLGTPTRLPIGTTGQVLTVTSGIPSWGAGYTPQFFISSGVSSKSTAITSTSYETFSNSPAFTFIPTVSGTYKVYCSAPIYSGVTGQPVNAQIINTSGGASTLATSQGSNSVNSGTSGGGFSSVYLQTIFTLTASTSYVFDIQGQSYSGDAVYLDAMDAGITFFMFAERVL
jgi:hypothetical protein